MKIIRFLNRHKIIVFIFLILTAVLIVYLKNRPSPLITPPTQTESNTQYKGVQAGSTSESDLISSLGEPIGKREENGYNIYSYDSEFKNFPSEVYLKNGQAEFIKEPVKYEENRKIEEYINTYGQPDLKMYSPDWGGGYIGNIYTNKGVVVFSHKKDGSVIEMWYFPPTTPEDFLATWGQNLLEQSPDRPE